MAGTDAVYPARKSDRRMLIGAATMRMTTSVGPPSQTEIGINAVSTARPTSARNIIRFRSLRSARAPATMPNSRSGSVWRAPTRPIAAPEPVSANTRSGRAVKLTASPIDDTPCVESSVLKSRLRPSGSSTPSTLRLRSGFGRAEALRVAHLRPDPCLRVREHLADVVAVVVDPFGREIGDAQPAHDGVNA